MSTPFGELHTKIDALEEEWQAAHELPAGMKLYHFTSPEGLAGILNSRSIWATLATGLGDSKELLHFLRPKENRPDQSRPLSRFQTGKDLIFGDLLVDPAEDPVGAWRQARGPFLVCFCPADCWEAVDDLYFWRTFGREGKGYALGFEPRATKAPPVRSMGIARRVIYDERAAHEFESRIDELCGEVKCAHRAECKRVRKEATSDISREKKISRTESWTNTQLRRLHRVMLELVVCRKGSKFSIEVESRLIAKGQDGTVKVRSSGGAVVPYIDYPISIPEMPLAGRRSARNQLSLTLKEIVIGPAANARVAEPSLRFLLGDNKMKRDVVEIYHSSLSIR